MHEILRETPIFQEILREGLEQGQLKQARSTLLKFTNNRFPSLISLAENCAANIDNIKVLEDLAFQVAVVQRLMTQ